MEKSTFKHKSVAINCGVIDIESTPIDATAIERDARTILKARQRDAHLGVFVGYFERALV